MRRFTGALLLSGALAVGLPACGAGTPKPEATFVETDAFNAGHVTTIFPGSAEYVTPNIDPKTINVIVSGLELIDNQYSHGFGDKDAPKVSRKPIRIDAHTALSGDAPRFDNDVACDTVNLALEEFEDLTKVYIGALALSDEEADMVLVSWPKQQGSPSKTAELCFDNGNEPRDGVVLFLSDTPR